MPGFDRSMVGELIFPLAVCCVMCNVMQQRRSTRRPKWAMLNFQSNIYSRPVPFTLSDRNSTSVPLYPQKFNNAAVIMYLFALFPWARWLLASLNIRQDNLWISICWFYRSLYEAVPSCVLTALLNSFYFLVLRVLCHGFAEVDSSCHFAFFSQPCSPLWKF